jgi:hypothetical protein
VRIGTKKGVSPEIVWIPEKRRAGRVAGKKSKAAG